MPDKQYIRACSLKEIPKSRGRRIDVDEDTQIAVFNIEGRLFAVSNICPHQHSPLIFEGMIENCTVTCPLHGWVFDLETGAALNGGGGLKTYDIQLEGDDVMIEKPEPHEPAWMKW